jgi:hypothetical protein
MSKSAYPSHMGRFVETRLVLRREALGAGSSCIFRV